MGYQPASKGRIVLLYPSLEAETADAEVAVIVGAPTHHHADLFVLPTPSSPGRTVGGVLRRSEAEKIDDDPDQTWSGPAWGFPPPVSSVDDEPAPAAGG